MGEIATGFKVPDDQRIQYRITPLPGRMMSLEAIGGQLQALGKVWKACSAGEKVKFEPFVLGIETDAEGSVTFTIALLPRVKGCGAKRPAPQSVDEAGGGNGR